MQKIVFCIGIISLLFCFSCKRTNESDSKKDKLTDSIEIISNLIRKNPKNSELFIKRSDLQLIEGNIDEAINDMEIAMRIDSTKPMYYSKLSGLYLLKNGKSENAKKILEKCTEKYPSYPQAYIDLAKIYLYVGMFQEAMEKIMFIENNGMQNGDSYFVKGVILRKASETESDTASCKKWKLDALKAFKKSIEYDNENWEAHNYIGIIYTEIQDSIAIEYFKTAMHLFPKNQEVLYFAAWSYNSFNKYEDAKNTYSKALEIDTVGFWAYKSYIDLGNLYYDVSLEPNKYDVAIRFYTKAISCDTTSIDAYCKRAAAFSANKKFKLAETDYRKALKITPNYEPAIEGLNNVIAKERK